MRGDDAQRSAAGGDATRVKKGPRHAAPRKSLLTKLQIPAGKAMALAAMPTAVMVGMGLTPRLAMADDKEIPFAPGPCVTRSDEPDASASSSPAPTPTSTSSASPTSSPTAPTSSPAPPSSSAAPSPSASAPDPDEDREQAPLPSGSADASAPPEPEPTASSDNPLDPLGLGVALNGLLGGGEAEDSSGTEAIAPAAEKRKESAAEESAEESAAEDAKKADDAAAKAAEDAIRKAAERVGATVEELAEEAKGLGTRADDDIPAAATGTSTAGTTAGATGTGTTSGKEPFPCPTPDPAALAAAERERGIPLLPDEPWQLDSSLLTLSGLYYHGIVEVRTGGGKTKKALKFTATSLDIKDLHQTAGYPLGMTAHVQGRTGSTSTIRGGEVTMYTEELKGNLYGIIPVTFSPATPPPLNLPFVFFTQAHVIQAGQFGGTLTIPGLRNYLTG
ncbi:hypothetical protein [Streptomyces paludis]|uniref:Hydrogenase expression protein HypF n=1 Tax=Streptomyces paludis TaxID=2282738 RepID=A0A345HUH4_9ACTN|nr:hypothetical protein [Streptomyces paludis]AXG80348.1 hypothetical protein DVK44_24790 [Streptomyces paludis]